LSQEKT